MRRRHLESVSSRSLSVRGSWGTVPSVFWYGAPGGTRGPLGKGGAAERWRVTPSVSWVTRHGAQPATTRTHKRNAPAASRTGFAPCKINAPPLGDHNLGLIFLLPTFLHRKVGPRRVGALTKPCKRLRDADRREDAIAINVNPSVSLAADSLSLRLGHGAALICHRHIIHYRAATSLPLTQGSLWVGAAPHPLRRGACGVG